MTRTRAILPLAAAMALAACREQEPTAPTNGTMEPTRTFDEEVAFLRQYGAIHVLEAEDGGRIAISGQYQARVMTSAVEAGGKSLGYVNRSFIASRKVDTPFDNYGGEDRFWLGPEGGQFGLYFPPGKPFTLANWQTPSALQRGAWPIRESGKSDVVFEYAIDVTNWSGAVFHAFVRRTIALLSKRDVEGALGVELPAGVRFVGFESKNELQNYGEAWKKETGLVSIWILGQYVPAPDMRVIVPFDLGTGPIVNDAYFGKVPPERLKIDANEGFLTFLCDGHYRSKIGLGPTHAKPVLGSYSAQTKTLTIVQYDKPAGVTDYVNSMWEEQKDPYGGDVVNAYNDGPLEPGKPSLGGFYEMETSSPAAALEKDAKPLVHVHRTFHFVGDEQALDAIASKVLGVSLRRLP